MISIGIKLLLCLIVIILTMIAERGVPVRLQKWDHTLYIFLFFILIAISNME